MYNVALLALYESDSIIERIYLSNSLYSRDIRQIAVFYDLISSEERKELFSSVWGN